jgi:hypothetical protein
LNFVFNRPLPERLGGTVVEDWHEASYLFSDSAANALVRQIMGNDQEEMLVFHPHFILDCIAHERIINGGPYILQREATEEAAAEQASDAEDGGSSEIVSVRDTPQRAARGTKRGPTGRERSPLQVSPSPRKQRPTKRAAPVDVERVAPTAASIHREKRQLSDLGSPENLDALVAEFEDFVPNQKGFVVRVIEHRG